MGVNLKNMLRLKWLNLVLVAVLALSPLQITFAQIGQPVRPAPIEAGAQPTGQAHHAKHEHAAVAGTHDTQQSGQPCGEHKGPCPACGMCGAHCSASLMSFEFAPVIVHTAVVITPLLLTAILSQPPPGDPPRFSLS